MGLVDRWAKTYFPKPKRCAIDESDGHRMGLSDIQGVFIVLALLIGISTLILLMEVLTSTKAIGNRLIEMKENIIRQLSLKK